VRSALQDNSDLRVAYWRQLRFYGYLEIAWLADMLPADSLLDHLMTSLESELQLMTPFLLRYAYPFLLLLLRVRHQRKIREEGIERSWLFISRFISLSNALYENPDFWVFHDSLADEALGNECLHVTLIRSAVSSPQALATAMQDGSDDFRLLEAALSGFSSYLQFVVAFRALLDEITFSVTLRAEMWSFHAPLFHPNLKFSEEVRNLMQMLVGSVDNNWVADETVEVTAQLSWLQLPDHFEPIAHEFEDPDIYGLPQIVHI
jgi:hypothetical protein